jgi:hypothetical protein
MPGLRPGLRPGLMPGLMPEPGPTGVLHPSWRRVVLKLSGGLFAGAEPVGISPDVVEKVGTLICRDDPENPRYGDEREGG